MNYNETYKNVTVQLVRDEIGEGLIWDVDGRIEIRWCSVVRQEKNKNYNAVTNQNVHLSFCLSDINENTMKIQWWHCSMAGASRFDCGLYVMLG